MVLMSEHVSGVYVGQAIGHRTELFPVLQNEGILLRKDEKPVYNYCCLLGEEPLAGRLEQL